MTYFDPGHGWRQVPNMDQTIHGERIVYVDEHDKSTQIWVPGNDLPTDLYTTIRVTWRPQGATPAEHDSVLWLTPLGWVDAKGTAVMPDEVAGLMDTYETLAEPRTNTVQAVIEAAGGLLNSYAQEDIRKELGVTEPTRKHDDD